MRNLPALFARIGITACVLLTISCGGEGSGSTGPAVSVLTTVTVDLAATSIQVGQTTSATATARDQNGVIMSVGQVTWLTSSASVATVSSSGVVTGVAAGQASVIASVGGKQGQQSVTVVPASVTTVTVSPASKSLVIGGTQQLTATTLGATGAILTGRTINWTTSDATTAIVSSNGLISAVGVGTATATATSEGKSGTAVITVTLLAPVATVLVSPATLTVSLGSPQQLVATTLDENGTVLTGRTITWASSAPTRATVSSTGVVTAVSVGTATITATSEGKSGTSTVTIAVPVDHVLVNPGALTAIVGGSQQLTATTYDINGGTLTGRTITWTSTDPTKAPVSPTGLVTLLSAGTAVITATSEGKSGSSAVTIESPVATVSVAPAAAIVFVGKSVQLTATTLGTNGAVLSIPRIIVWTTSDATKATVSLTGLVTALAAGTSTITATSEGKSGTSTLTTLTVTAVTVGGLHVCGLTAAGAAYCWGDNTSGQLGNGATTNSQTPVPVQGGLSFTALTTGFSHVCGLTSTGAAYCWGANGYGQLGDGSTTTRRTPVAVQGGRVFASLTAGTDHTCGVTTSGAAYCWGWNIYGGLGDGSTIDRQTPVAVQGGRVFTSLAAGAQHTCGVSAGTAYCWGDNFYGELGDGTLNDRLTPSLSVQGGLAFAALAAGASYTCGLTLTGAAYCWGSSVFGQLGNGQGDDGSLYPHRATPVAVQGGLGFSALSAGGGHTCGITGQGVAYCWGLNDNGQAGGPTTTNLLTPTALFQAGSFVLAVRAGGDNTCVLTTAGQAECFGYIQTHSVIK